MAKRESFDSRGYRWASRHPKTYGAIVGAIGAVYFLLQFNFDYPLVSIAAGVAGGLFVWWLVRPGGIGHRWRRRYEERREEHDGRVVVDGQTSEERRATEFGGPYRWASRHPRTWGIAVGVGFALVGSWGATSSFRVVWLFLAVGMGFLAWWIVRPGGPGHRDDASGSR